jgi:predicted phage-related endonuclease
MDNQAATLTPEQQSVRRRRVTGSTVAAFLGYSPWQTPREAWEESTGQRSFDGNAHTEIGQILEPGLIQLAQRQLTRRAGFHVDREAPAIEGPFAIMEKPGTVFAPGRDWALCHPDAVFPQQEHGLQIKNSGFRMAKGYKAKPDGRLDGPHENEVIPLYHLMQCQWEMMCAGYFTWWLGVYFGGNDFRLYRLAYDALLVDAMLAAAEKFWREHLDPSGPQTAPADSAAANQGREDRAYSTLKQSRMRPIDFLSAPIPQL